MKFQEVLKGVTKIFIDTAPIIYFIEAHPQYGVIVKEILEMINKSKIEAYSSVITLLEVLIKPYELGKKDLAETFKRFLLNSKNMSILEIDKEVAILAAELRGKYKYLKSLDALQLGSALKIGANLFFTNDKKLKNFKKLKIMCLSDLHL